MRRLTVLLPVIVFGAICVAFIAARMRANGRELPTFEPPRKVEFAKLEAPLGPLHLRGRVVDIDGQPVPGVSLFFRSGGVPFWGDCDAQGAFSFEGLSEAEVDVALIQWGRPPRMQHATAGDDVELTLTPALAPIPPLAAIESAPLAGRVSSPLGRSYWDPIGYEVALVPRTSPAEFGGAVERRVKCDAGGGFTLSDLAFGAYDVRVVPSWAAGTSWPDLVAPAFSRLDHDANSTRRIAVMLRCGALEGAVREASGAKLEGALVLVAEADDPKHIWPPQSTDPEGRFRFVDLPPGELRVTIRAGEGVLAETVLRIENGQVSRPELPPLVVRKR